MKTRTKLILLSYLVTVFVLSASCQSKVKKESVEKISAEIVAEDQEPSDFDPYFTEFEGVYSPDGPSNITRNVLQDKEGNIWLATWEGIIQYNGDTFTNYTNLKGLRRHRIFCLLEDSNGLLWFGSIGAGVYRYDGTDFTNYTTRDGLVNDRVSCIFEDRDGDIWFGTEQGLSHYDGESFKNYSIADGVPNGDINSIIQDHTGKLWIGARGEAFTYDGIRFETLVRNRGRAFVNVRCIMRSKKNDIWLGGNDGFWQWDGKKFINHATNFTGYIYEDRAGDIWTSSSEQGNPQQWTLSRYRRFPKVGSKNIETSISSELNMFFGITEDQEGNIWFGTLNGVRRYDGETIFDFNSSKQ